MTTEQKIKALVSGVCENMPALRQVDMKKRTPRGAEFLQAVDFCARRLYQETKDREWLEIARTFRHRHDVKPAPGLETK